MTGITQDTCCVVCGSVAVPHSRFEREELELLYAEAMQVERVPDLRAVELWNCTVCGLIFCHPAYVGTASFYSFINKHWTYYAKRRWEWDAIVAAVPVAAEKAGGLSVLDVGCGSGEFLTFARRRMPGLATFGLEIEASAADAARAAGHNVEVRTLEEFARTQEAEFSCVVMTHVLEHVADPVATIVAAKRMLAPRSVLCVSVPLSPTTVEGLRYDPLNLPPHHVTRWTERSMRALATRCGLRLELIFSPALALPNRAFNQLWYTRRGWAATSKLGKALEGVRHPLTFWRCVAEQFVIRGWRRHGDIMLAILSNGA